MNGTGPPERPSKTSGSPMSDGRGITPSVEIRLDRQPIGAANDWSDERWWGDLAVADVPS